MTLRAPPCTDAGGTLNCSSAARRLPGEKSALVPAAVDPGVGLVGMGTGGKEDAAWGLGACNVAIVEGVELGGEVILRKLEDAPGGTVSTCPGASCGSPIGRAPPGYGMVAMSRKMGCGRRPPARSQSADAKARCAKRLPQFVISKISHVPQATAQCPVSIPFCTNAPTCL